MQSKSSVRIQTKDKKKKAVLETREDIEPTLDVLDRIDYF